jgi:hypothetical protein
MGSVVTLVGEAGGHRGNAAAAYDDLVMGSAVCAAFGTAAGVPTAISVEVLRS